MSDIKKNEDLDIEVLKYVEGREVSKRFIEMLEIDKDLLKKVLNLKSDIFLMNKIKDSKMFLSIKKDASIKIKKSEIDYISGFTLLSPITSRGKDEEKTKVYYFENTQIIIKDNTVSLNIESIKQSCIIYKDKKEIASIKSMKGYSTLLEKGEYNIELDSVSIKLNIE